MGFLAETEDRIDALSGRKELFCEKKLFWSIKYRNQYPFTRKRQHNQFSID
jgi:hypothetical protein